MCSSEQGAHFTRSKLNDRSGSPIMRSMFWMPMIGELTLCSSHPLPLRQQEQGMCCPISARIAPLYVSERSHC